MTDDLPERRSASARALARLGRHVFWARRDGIGRLIEEDQLDPRERWGQALARYRWRRAHGEVGQARAALVVGVQRSGTNMLTRGLEAMPEVEVHNENDRAVFDRFQLRSLSALTTTVAASPHALVLFKPICDSHNTDLMLDALAEVGADPVALWAWRSVDDRVRSAVAKFGSVNQQVLTRLAAGEYLDGWQAGRLTEEALETVRSLDPAKLSAESGAAAFWWLRNRLYFSTGLDQRTDVLLVGYDDVVRAPAETLQTVCSRLGLTWRPEVSAHIEQRSATRPPLDLDPRVRALTDELTERLLAASTLGRPS